MCNINSLIKKILCNERNRRASKNSQRSKSLEPQRSKKVNENQIETIKKNSLKIWSQTDKKESLIRQNKVEALKEINSMETRPLLLEANSAQNRCEELTTEEKADLVARIIKSLELPATFCINAQTYQFICEYIETHGGYEKFQEELEKKQRQAETSSMNTLRSNQSNNHYVNKKIKVF